MAFSSGEVDPLAALTDLGPNDQVAASHVRVLAESVNDLLDAMKERSKADIKIRKTQMLLLKSSSLIAKSMANFERKNGLPMVCKILQRNIVSKYIFCS